jgi:GH15 family glucan-1,4-alpha-glucosidase
MAARIEDYALLSNCRTAALVSRTGSIDWLCLPRLDSPSVFGALLGDEAHGRWELHPADADAECSRRYDGDTFVLITRWELDDAIAEVHDFMPIGLDPDVAIRRTDLVRRIVGVQGEMDFVQQISIRFDYARGMPWVRQTGTADEPCLVAMGGPDAVAFRGAQLTAVDHQHRGELTVSAGDERDLQLTWFPSHREVPAPLVVDDEVERTKDWWQSWADRISHDGPRRGDVVRSLLLLRALTNHETGGIAAAATMALPEEIGGVRNWDYRYVWLRDAALTLEALLDHGFLTVADRWREWLLRAVAGDPADLQIMYGLAGERRLPEVELPWLPGFADSAPVRIGNEAVNQLQLDVYGEVMDSLYLARQSGLPTKPHMWDIQASLMDWLRSEWQQPDEGLWEVRGGRRHFVHSKIMVWVAADRAVRTLEENPELPGDLEGWRTLREDVHREVCEKGYDPERNTFTQYYGSRELDAALLLIPRVGFLPPDDPRVVGTIDAIREELGHHGFLRRYSTDGTTVDGLPGDEGTFLVCSFWLADALHMTGRTKEARELFERLVALTNDVGLLSEEYDPVEDRQLGNFPQAFSHVGLVNTALALFGDGGAG